MVVGGLPERNTEHAVCVANQALDMMHYCQQVVRPDNDEPLQVSQEPVKPVIEQKPVKPFFFLGGEQCLKTSKTGFKIN